MALLKQNLSTAVAAGPFILSTDGFTIDNAVTSTQITFYTVKNGVLSTAITLTTGAWSTSPVNGMYAHTFTTANVDTIGNLRFYYYTTARLPVWEDHYVLSSNIADFYTGTSAPGTPASVWANSSRDLSTYAALSSAIWTFTSRSLTSNLTSWAAADVWSVAARTITSAAAVWTETTRTITSAPAGNSTFAASDVWSVAARTITSAEAVWTETTRNLSSAGVVWNDLLETTVTYKQGMRGLTAAVLGNSTGGGTTAVKFRNVGSTVDRLTYDVTTEGNRTGVAFSW